ncbi:MAG: hypothetical protein MR384_02090 [Lachnospiraceae bacterium]|nr:hypothetical protein [Lachnospiraceae bacterium]MCI5586661.1 hypothetical protein [Lachnospiraceae bacterium]
MKTDYIPKVITLLAGAVVCIVTIVKGTETTTALEYLLATLIIFYIVGLIAKVIIKKVIDSNSFIKKEIENLELEEDNKKENDEIKASESEEDKDTNE